LPFASSTLKPDKTERIYQSRHLADPSQKQFFIMTSKTLVLNLPTRKSMRFSQFLIIYFACGVPFSIHYLVKSNKKISYRTIVNSLLVLLAWFLYAFEILIKTKSKKDQSPEEKILKIQRQICSFVKENSQNGNSLQSREIIQHYVSLTLARNENTPQKESFELLKISGHPKPVVGTKCIQRRNNRKIDSHLKSARNRFLDLISRCSNPEKAVEIAEELANALNDKEAKFLLKNISELRNSATTPAISKKSIKAISVQ
jgi:hypothetical protein